MSEVVMSLIVTIIKEEEEEEKESTAAATLPRVNLGKCCVAAFFSLERVKGKKKRK